jgi:ABC-type uncharacterized transport system involved in gliding motility auxiliary subunit
MNRITAYIGPIGLGALVAGIFLWLFTPDRDRIWASFLIAGMLLTVTYLGSRWREVMALAGRRGARYGTNLAVLIALVTGIVVAVNYLANRHNKRWDLTAAKQYSLSDQSVKIVENLDRDLEIAILDRSDQALAARELVDQYRYHSKRISVEVIDQEAEPIRAAKYKTETESTIPFGTIVIDGGDRVERITSATEQELTNAIIKVLKEGKKKIVFVEGHGEKDIDEPGPEGASLIKAKLEESNYEVATFHPLESMRQGRIELPEDATAVVIAGPQRDYLPAEIDALRDYLKGGGKALFLLDPKIQGEKPNLVNLMNELGMELGDNVVIDLSSVGQLFGYGPEVPLVTTYGYHPITEIMKQGSVFPVVRSVQGADSPPDGTVVTELLSTSENSWAEENLDGLSEGVQPDEGETTGSLSLGVAVTMEVEKPPAEDETDSSEGSEEAEPGEEDVPESEEEELPQPEGRMVVVGDSMKTSYPSARASPRIGV